MKYYSLYLTFIIILLTITTCTQHDDDEPTSPTLYGSLYFASSKLSTASLGYQFLKRTIYLQTSTDVTNAYIIHSHSILREKEIRDIGKLFYQSEKLKLFVFDISWNSFLHPYEYGTNFHFEITDGKTTKSVYNEDETEEDFTLSTDNDALLGYDVEIKLSEAMINDGKLEGEIVTEPGSKQKVTVRYSVDNVKEEIEAYKYFELPSELEKWKFEVNVQSNVNEVYISELVYNYFDEDEYEFKKDTNFGKGYKISESGIDDIELYY